MSGENDGFLMIQDCTCTYPDCETFLIVLVNPVIKDIIDADPTSPIHGKAGFYLHVPMVHAQGVVDEIRQKCAKRGVVIR